MSIVKALNELSGKEANTIEKAIRNIELGGGGIDVLIVEQVKDEQTHIDTLSKTWNEINAYMSENKLVFIHEYRESHDNFFDEVMVKVDSIAYNSDNVKPYSISWMDGYMFADSDSPDGVLRVHNPS